MVLVEAPAIVWLRTVARVMFPELALITVNDLLAFATAEGSVAVEEVAVIFTTLSVARIEYALAAVVVRVPTPLISLTRSASHIFHGMENELNSGFLPSARIGDSYGGRFMPLWSQLTRLQ